MSCVLAFTAPAEMILSTMTAMFRTARRPSNNQSKEISILKKDKKITIYRRRGTIIIALRHFREVSKCEDFELRSRDAKHRISAAELRELFGNTEET